VSSFTPSFTLSEAAAKRTRSRREPRVAGPGPVRPRRFAPALTVNGLILLSLVIAGCDEDPFNRMYNQPKLRAQHSSDFFPDHRANRPPPAGTVPRERPLELELQAPPFTLGLLEKGRHRYEIVCATCHGLTGEADTIVSSNFALRQPPSFHEPRLREKPDSHLFTAVTLGYGVMPAFPEIPVDERWGIVGYVRALQLSQRVPLDEAPPEVRDRLRSGLAMNRGEP
jgi:mono/diheme cytochrome c family protein